MPQIVEPDDRGQPCPCQATHDHLFLVPSRAVWPVASPAVCVHISPQHGRGLRERYEVALAAMQIAACLGCSSLYSSYVHLASLCCICRAKRYTGDARWSEPHSNEVAASVVDFGLHRTTIC